MKTEYDQVKAILKRHNSLDMDIDDLDMIEAGGTDLTFTANSPSEVQRNAEKAMSAEVAHNSFCGS